MKKALVAAALAVSGAVVAVAVGTSKPARPEIPCSVSLPDGGVQRVPGVHSFMECLKGARTR